VIVLIRVVVGALLLAHGLVHLLYLAPDVPGFSIQKSWLLPQSGRRTVAKLLIAATIAAFACLAVAVWVPWLSGIWAILTIIASILSLMLLVAFWDPRVALGVLIDVALIAAAITDPQWIGDTIG
jgi:hypothetical protein